MASRATREKRSGFSAKPRARTRDRTALVVLVRVERDGEPPPVLQRHAVRVGKKLGDDHLALSHLVVHHAAEENGAFLREVRRGRRPRPRARREALLLLLLPTPGSQIQTPQIAVRHALLHVPVDGLDRESLRRIPPLAELHVHLLVVRSVVEVVPLPLKCHKLIQLSGKREQKN